MSKAKAVEKEYQELVERWCKLQRIYKLRESEILGDFIKWNHYFVKELEKIKKKQAEFETQLNNLKELPSDDG
jgi:hypothetical protein